MRKIDVRETMLAFKKNMLTDPMATYDMQLKIREVYVNRSHLQQILFGIFSGLFLIFNLNSILNGMSSFLVKIQTIESVDVKFNLLCSLVLSLLPA